MNNPKPPKKLQVYVVWTILACVITIPLIAAALSLQLAWRGPIYIIAGLAGIIAMALLFLQPLLAGKYIPGLSPPAERKTHRIIGLLIVIYIIIHLVGLWITSPPDVIDALLLRSPTPFSIWGVISMWAVVLLSILAILKRRLNLSHKSWRFYHLTLATIVVITTVVHALQIEGTMEILSKITLSVLVITATFKLWIDLHPWIFRK